MRHCSTRRTLANLWTRLRSPRPNRATGGYLLTGTSATREDELVAGRRRPQEQKDKEQQQQQRQLGRRGYAAADECLINVTDFSDIQTSEGAVEAATTTIAELRVPTITTANISSTSNSNHIATSNTTASSNNPSSNTSSNTSNNPSNNTSNNTSNTNNNTNNNNSNMSRIIQPRYRFRDLLLGDFSFNDDGER
ncbi:hypothetical protein KR009_000329 [Drosophila setifemur]|nr:hypothetical protein KR009_000329 [Drosophila setifemur]